MSTTTEFRGGFVDLTGRVFGKLAVLSIAHRNPLAWRCACRVCGSEFVLKHVLVPTGRCPREPLACRRVDSTATHDGSFTRAYVAERRPQSAPVREPDAVDQRLLDAELASPGGLRAYLDWRDSTNGK